MKEKYRNYYKITLILEKKMFEGQTVEELHQRVDEPNFIRRYRLNNYFNLYILCDINSKSQLITYIVTVYTKHIYIYICYRYDSNP